jgi:2-dehydro-3-deoxyphosphogalactonate aldolase
MKDFPRLVAILRGMTPADAPALGPVLVEAGFSAIEVPLNSPDPFRGIEALARAVGNVAWVGAGTVLCPDDVSRVADAGARFIVAPNFEPGVVAAASARKLPSMPGVATPSEAFNALAAGAEMLKIFPAEQIAPDVVKAWRAVLPEEARLYPVGGITPEKMPAYLAAGAQGFGIGSALWRPGASLASVRTAAGAFVKALANKKS